MSAIETCFLRVGAGSHQSSPTPPDPSPLKGGGGRNCAARTHSLSALEGGEGRGEVAFLCRLLPRLDFAHEIREHAGDFGLVRRPLLPRNQRPVFVLDRQLVKAAAGDALLAILRTF